MANSEKYYPIGGITTGPRGVVTDLPCVFFHSATAATFNAIASGAGLLHSVTIFPVATATIQIFDNITAVGTVILGPSAAMVAGNGFTIYLDVLFGTGLSMIVGVAAIDVCVAFRTN